MLNIHIYVVQEYRLFKIENINKSKIYNIIIFSLFEKKPNLNFFFIDNCNVFCKLYVVIYVFIQFLNSIFKKKLIEKKLNSFFIFFY